MRQAVSRTQMWVRGRMPVCGLNWTHGLVPYKGDKGDKNAARPPEGSLVETRCLIKGPKSAIAPFPGPCSGPKSRTGPGASQKAKSRFEQRVWTKESLSTGSVRKLRSPQSKSLVVIRNDPQEIPSQYDIFNFSAFVRFLPYIMENVKKSLY